MRVLVITTWFPSPRAPGAGSFVADDVRLLARTHEVTVLHLIPSADALGAPLTESVDGVQIRRFPMSPSRPWQLFRASRVIRRLLAGADVVHTMALSSLLPMAFVRVSIPWLHTEHWSGLLAPETIPRAMRVTLPLTERGLRRPDRVVAVSRGLAERISEVRAGAVDVIPNHVATPGNPAPNRNGSEGLRIISVGNLVPRKGSILAVQTIAELRRRGVDASLTWLGDGPLRAASQAEADRQGISDHVDFPGAAPKATVTDLLRDADVFLLPTESETFGVSIAESLVAGTPVVVGARGAQTEFVSEPDGVLVEERTPEAYADAVQRVCALNRSRSSGEIGAAARMTFSDETRARDYAAAYRAAGTHENDPGALMVDVIIAVHQLSRPIERAVSSVLRNRASLRVTVVCHNIAADDVARRLGELVHDPRVRLRELKDGLSRPAGPFNLGLELAEARFTSVMGSDDELEPGAVDSWIAVALRDGAEVVIPRVARAGGHLVPTPPSRPWRSRRLDMVRDRLSYRSAPLGLVSRVRFGEVRLDPQVATGEDVEYVTRLWSQSSRISRSRGPAYLIHADAESRTSTASRPIEEDLRFIGALLSSTTFQTLNVVQRDAVVTKILRINLIGAVHNRRDTGWRPGDREALAEVLTDLRRTAPRAQRPLSRMDRRLLDLMASSSAPESELRSAADARLHRLRPESLIARDVSATLHREGALRMSAASWLALISVARFFRRAR